MFARKGEEKSVKKRIKQTEKKEKDGEEGQSKNKKNREFFVVCKKIYLDCFFIGFTFT